MEYDSSSLVSQLYLEEKVREISVRIPRGLPLEWRAMQFVDAADGTPYTLADGTYNPRSHSCRLLFTSSKKSDPSVRLIFSFSDRYYSKTARIAFLLRRFGFEANTTTIRYLSFPHPLTVSLLPADATTEWTAKIADHYQKEIVITLPFESRTALPREMNSLQIMIHHSPEEIREKMNTFVTAVPHYSGFMAVYGSRALQDTRIVGTVLEEIKRLNGYVIDANGSEAARLKHEAKKQKVPYRAVDGTIWGEMTAEETAGRLEHAIVRAHKSGDLLIQCDPAPALIAQLEAMADRFASNGIVLSYVSDILRPR